MRLDEQCTCMAGHASVGNAIIFQQGQGGKVSNFKQPLLGSVKVTEVFEVVQ